MASPDIIEIIISAKDMASGVIAKAAAETKMASAEVNSSLNSTSKEAGGLAGALGFGPGALALAAGTAAAVIGVSAVKAAGDFQQQLTKLVTSAGESASNLGLVSDGIKKIAIETGASTTSLADGMYKVSSAGFHGADGLNVLKAAEQGAKAEGASLETVADAVSSALIDYHLKASDAADVTSKLVAATAAGKMRFEELAGAMPAILPVASAAHVSLSDILGDMASMTVHGMSAEQSAQNLADTIRHMVNPTAQQAKELAMLGMTTTQLAGDLKTHGLSGTLQEISNKIADLMAPGSDKVILNLKTALNGLPDQVKQLGVHLFDGSMSMKEYAKAAAGLDPIAAKQAISFATLAGATHRIGDQQMTGAQVMQNYTQALAKATGDATGLNVALMLTGENAAYTNSAIKSVSDAAVEAGGNVKGWAEIQKNFNQQMAQLGQVFQVGLLSVGQWLIGVYEAASKYLVPVFGVIKKAWDDYLMPAFNWISGGDGQKAIDFFGKGLGFAIGIAATNLVLLAGAVMVVVAAMVRIVNTAEDVVKWLGENIPIAAQIAVQAVTGWWQKLVSDTERDWSNFKNSIQKAWDDTGKAISDGVDSAILAIREFPLGAAKAVGDGWDKVTKAVSDGWDSTTKAVSDGVGKAAKAAADFPGQVAKAVGDGWTSVTTAISNGWNTIVQNAPKWGKNVADGYMQGMQTLANYDIQSVMQWGKGISDFFNGGLKWGGSVIKGIGDGITNGFSAATKWAGDVITAIGKGIVAGYNSAVKWGTDLLASIGKGIVAGYNTATKWAGDLIGNFGKGITEAYTNAVKWGKDLIANIGKGITNAYNAAIKWGQDVVGNIVKGLQDGVGSIGKFFQNLPNTISEWVKNSGKQVADQHVDGMKKNFTDFDKMKDLGQNILKGLGIAILAIVGGILLVGVSIGIAIINGIIWGFNAMVTAIGKWIDDLWPKVVSGFNSFTSSAVKWAQDTVGSIVSEFGKLPGQITSSIGGAFDSANKNVNNWLGSVGNNIGNFFNPNPNHHALGTNFAPGGLTMVGENGPELVNMPTGSKVYTVKQTQQMASQSNGSGVTINGGLHIHNNMDEQRFLAQMGMRLALR